MRRDEIHQHLDDVPLDRVAPQARDEGVRHLDEVRPELRDRLEGGVTRAGVVDGDAKAELAQARQRAAEDRDVADRRALGDLEDDGVLSLEEGRDPLGPAPGQGRDAVRFDVDEQVAGASRG